MPSSGFSPFPEILEVVGGAISADAWVLDSNDVGDRSAIQGWDYAMPLRLFRRIAFDPVRIRQDCGLGRGSTLRVAASWTAQAAVNLGALGAKIDFKLVDDAPLECQLDMDVSSAQLAEALELHTVVVLQDRGEDADALAAREPGSILWQDRGTLTLEGSRPRMPILPADFSKFPNPQRGAAWSVWTGPEWLAQHPSAGITVLINSARLALLAALRARKASAQDAILQSIFLHEVGRTLIERALDDDDFTDYEIYARGTAGHSLKATLKTLFDRQPLERIRQLRKTSPADFERVLQTRHRLLEALE